MKKISPKGNIFLPILICITIIFVLTLGLYFYSNSVKNPSLVSKTSNTQRLEKKESPIPQETMKNYTWKNFKLGFVIPNGFIIDENTNSIVLLNKEQRIEISTVGTNFDTIEEYFNDISIKNKLTYKSKENLIINGKESLKTIRDTSEQKEELTFWIYHNYSLFFISTTDKELYSTTEEVAKSIRFD